MYAQLRLSLSLLIIALGWTALSNYLIGNYITGRYLQSILDSYKEYASILAIAILFHIFSVKTKKRLVRKSQFLSHAQELAKVGGWEYIIKDKKYLISKDLRKMLHLQESDKPVDAVTVYNYIHPEDKKLVLKRFRHSLETGDDYRVIHRLVTPEGKILFINEIAKIESINGYPSIVRGVAQDITETILLRDSLESTSQRNHQLMEVMSLIDDFVMLLDKNGKITWVNPSFNKITGYTLSEVAGLYPGDFLEGADTHPEASRSLRECIANNSYCSIEILSYTRSGKKYWAQVNATPFLQNGSLAFIVIGSNISKRKLVESKLQQQNNLLKKLNWTLSHQIRRPVASIQGLNILIKQSRDELEKQEYYEAIITCADELDKVVKDVNNKINFMDI